MGIVEYNISRQLDRIDTPFESLVMAAMRKADTANLERLREAFPELEAELRARYDAPLGLLDGERSLDGKHRRERDEIIDNETGQTVRMVQED